VNAWTWLVVVASVLVTTGLAILLIGGSNPADLSEQEGKAPRQGRHLVDRPAGPDAEAMEAPASESRNDRPEPEAGPT